MSDYSRAQFMRTGHAHYGPATAQEALDATLRYPGESWLPVRAEAVCAALFGVLMHSQQERALEALGWRKVPPPAPTPIRPDPARPGDVEFVSWRELLDLRNREALGVAYGRPDGVGGTATTEEKKP